jgi:hypothetical protein
VLARKKKWKDRHETDIPILKRRNIKERWVPIKSKIKQDELHEIVRLQNNPLWLNAVVLKPTRMALSLSQLCRLVPCTVYVAALCGE